MQCANPRRITPSKARPAWHPVPKRIKPLTVPCGKCIPCLHNKRSDWQFRLRQEWKASKSAHFVTLTYAWKFLPDGGSLSKRDLQLFLKRLRKKDDGAKIRYYAVGEYGSKRKRAHYHLLLFNCTDTRYIRESWTDPDTKEPYGIVHIGGVSVASVGYVTKYLIQPDLAVPNLEKPFAVMSRGYGIGGHYLTDEMVAWHRNGDKSYVIYDGNQARLPRFYREKIWHRQEDRDRVSRKSRFISIKAARTEHKAYLKMYGPERYKAKRAEMQLAALSRIKVKVAYTQTL